MVGDSRSTCAPAAPPAVRTIGVRYGFDPEGLLRRRPTCWWTTRAELGAIA